MEIVLKRVNISAKNQIRGKIIALDPGPSVCMVTIDLLEYNTDENIYSSIPVDQVDELNLKLDDTVICLFPASSVMLAKE